MKIKLTAKFHPSRKGNVVEIDDLMAEALIKEGKADAVEAKEKGKGKKQVEEPQASEPAQEPTTEPTTEGDEIVID